ncbi:MAG TPA: vanadium-dependent haloperoxidase [Vicinamibacterales bacterium]|nr:vanadium-dependent haloperoxidase [Vicinamibacterales bacterium]
MPLMRTLRIFACAFLLCASTAGADVISDWNLQTAQRVAASSPPRRGPSAVIDFAMVHLAMHDAVQGFEKRYEPYCTQIIGATGSPVAAASKAARDVLAGLFPSQTATIDAMYTSLNMTYISQGLMVPGDQGAVAGAQAAKCMLDRRLAVDNALRNTPDSFMGATDTGAWRPTVFSNTGAPLPMAADFLAKMVPFAVKDPDQFRVENHAPYLESGAYAKAYQEVKDKGANDATGHTRTPEETATGRFFSDAPGNYWNRLQRDLVVSEELNLGDSARMFALVAMATADAIITCWDTKIHYNVWRPITAIREGDNDGNPETIGNPSWTSFFAAPNYPDYTSGANNVSAATTTILAHLFGDKMEFTLFSNAAGAVPRSYTRFSDVARDVVDARIFMGIHFRFADTNALRQGTHVADWTFSHYLRPIGGNRR